MHTQSTAYTLPTKFEVRLWWWYCSRSNKCLLDPERAHKSFTTVPRCSSESSHTFTAYGSHPIGWVKGLPRLPTRGAHAARAACGHTRKAHRAKAQSSASECPWNVLDELISPHSSTFPPLISPALSVVTFVSPSRLPQVPYTSPLPVSTGKHQHRSSIW